MEDQEIVIEIEDPREDVETEDARTVATRGGRRISAGTLLTRVLGFAREVLSGAFFGAGSSFDAFVIASTIPNLFRRVLGEEMFERAFMPHFRRLIAEGRAAQARAFLVRIFLIATGTMFGVSAAILAGLPWIVNYLAPGFDPGQTAEAVRLARMFIPFLVIIGVSAFLGSILQFSGKTLLFSTAPAVTNLIVIIVLICGHTKLSVTALLIGWLAGGLGAILFQLVPTIKIIRAMPTPGPNFDSPEIKPALVQGGHILSASIVSKSVEIVDRVVASLLGSGAISSLYYSFRLVHLPFSVLSLALSRAIGPELSRLRGEKDSGGFNRLIAFGFEFNVLVLCPLILFLIMMAEPVVRVFYQRGAFDADAVAETARAYTYYAPAIFGLGLIGLMNRVYSALEDNRIPLLAAGIGGVTNIVLDLLLYRTPLKQGGIALASSIGLFLQASVMMGLTRRWGVALPWRKLSIAGIRLVPALAVGLGVGLPIRYSWHWDNGFLWTFLGLALAATAFFAAVGGVLQLILPGGLRGIFRAEAQPQD